MASEVRKFTILLLPFGLSCYIVVAARVRNSFFKIKFHILLPRDVLLHTRFSFEQLCYRCADVQIADAVSRSFQPKNR